jgi:hypothetical protein
MTEATIKLWRQGHVGEYDISFSYHQLVRKNFTPQFAKNIRVFAKAVEGVGDAACGGVVPRKYEETNLAYSLALY